MVAAGCSGPTQDRVLSFLGCKSFDNLKSQFSEMMSIANNSCDRMDEGCPKFSFVNGVWVDKRLRLKPSYQQSVSEIFESQAKNIDFNRVEEAIQEINSWAEKHSEGLITNVLQPIHIQPLTRLILANALYFKGYWRHKFNPEWTEVDDFYLPNGDKISVPFMTNSKWYQYGSFDGFEVLEIPYESSKKDEKIFSMQFILPDKKDGLPNLIEKFISADSGFLNQHFELNAKRRTHFRIPKFKFSYTLDDIKFPFMEEDPMLELTEVGVDAENGDPLLITDIIQKAFIEVDEQGTEAAAVTFGPVFGCDIFSNSEFNSFAADHPFLFIIKEEKSGSVLFTGAVLNPLLG